MSAIESIGASSTEEEFSFAKEHVLRKKYDGGEWKDEKRDENSRNGK